MGAPQQSPMLSQAGMTFPQQGQQGLVSPMAQQGAPLIMNPPLGIAGINPYAAVMQQQGMSQSFFLINMYRLIYCNKICRFSHIMPVIAVLKELSLRYNCGCKPRFVL